MFDRPRCEHASKLNHRRAGAFELDDGNDAARRVVVFDGRPARHNLELDRCDVDVRFAQRNERDAADGLAGQRLRPVVVRELKLAVVVDRAPVFGGRFGDRARLIVEDGDAPAALVAIDPVDVAAKFDAVELDVGFDLAADDFERFLFRALFQPREIFFRGALRAQPIEPELDFGAEIRAMRLKRRVDFAFEAHLQVARRDAGDRRIDFMEGFERGVKRGAVGRCRTRFVFNRAAEITEVPLARTLRIEVQRRGAEVPVSGKRTIGFLRSELRRFYIRCTRYRLRFELAHQCKLDVLRFPRFSKTLASVIDSRRDCKNRVTIVERELTHDRCDDFACGRALRAVCRADPFGQMLVTRSNPCERIAHAAQRPRVNARFLAGSFLWKRDSELGEPRRDRVAHCRWNLGIVGGQRRVNTPCERWAPDTPLCRAIQHRAQKRDQAAADEPFHTPCFQPRGLRPSFVKHNVVRRIIVGVSGASGSAYAFALMRALNATSDVETHLVLSKQAPLTIELEMPTQNASDLEKLADVVHRESDLAASISSGSFRTDGMVVIPCSIKTASSIAYSFNDNLVARAADVCLKERRKLVLVVRETPLHLGHLRTLTQLAEIGAVILPPVPGMYARPQNVEDILNHTVGKVLDQLGVENELFTRWR